MKFLFNTTELTQTFAEEVVNCLQLFGRSSEEAAIRTVNEFFASAGLGEFGDNDLLLHDGPYYLALSILHHPTFGDNRPYWWKDPTLWPPPKEYKSKHWP